MSFGIAAIVQKPSTVNPIEKFALAKGLQQANDTTKCCSQMVRCVAQKRVISQKKGCVFFSTSHFHQTGLRPPMKGIPSCLKGGHLSLPPHGHGRQPRMGCAA